MVISGPEKEFLEARSVFQRSLSKESQGMMSDRKRKEAVFVMAVLGGIEAHAGGKGGC